MYSLVLTCQWAVLCLISDVVAFYDPTALPRLLPMHSSHYEQITGVQRRSMDQHWDTEPQQQAEIFWGLQREEDTFTIANMTLQAPPNLPIVLLERFDHMTSDVDCKGDDGEMSLTFKSEYAFRQASSAWKYINDHEDHRFLLIANHKGCGPGDERQPYIITKVREDPTTLTTHLASDPIELHKIARDFDLHFGHFKPSQSPLARRQAISCFTPWPASNCPQNSGGKKWTNKDSPFAFKLNTDSTQVFGARE
ncbi:hypothetical protein MMC07_004434 [Pseudocyphellaria aurata]|nr:hypothetical protein [Pseudocyphellaria aurata]